MQRITLEELDRFAQELASLSHSGVPMPEGMEMLAASLTPGAVQKIAAAIAPKLKQGVPLSEALASTSPKLPAEFIALVQCGERTGDMRPVLDHATGTSRMLRRHHEAIYTTLFYPLIVVVVAVAILIFVSHKLLPQFRDIFAQLGAELPWLTQTVMDVGAVLEGDLGLILLGVVAAIAAILFTSVAARERVLGFASVLPMFRELTLLCDTSAAMRYLSVMLGSGAPLPAALSSAALAVTYKPFAANLRAMAEAAERGQPVGPLLGRFMPATASYLFLRGEREGRLAEACGGIAEYTQGRFDRVGRRAILLLEPIVLVLVAFFIAVLATALWVPMFSLPRLVR